MLLLKRDTAAAGTKSGARAKSTDADLARTLARGAGEILLGLQSEPTTVDGQSLGAEGDRRSQEFLTKAVRRARPKDHVLSEEAPDDPGRLQADRVWIIDPLDGTREFAEGRRDWAVHVALWREGELVAGAVALPRLGMVFSGQGQDQDGTGQTAAHSGPRTAAGLRIAVSRTRAPRLAAAVADRIGAKLVPMGSAGFKVCAVAGGEADAYLHDGGQYEWDSAAPVVVARAAGLHVSRLDGSAPRYNQQNPYLPDLLICRPELSEALLEAIRELMPRGKQPEGKPDE